MTLSNVFKRAVNAQQTSEVFIVLLTIDNDDFVNPIRLASDPMTDLPDAGVKGVLSRGDEYIFLPFNVSLPSQDGSGVARARLSVDNISREITAYARQAKSALRVKIEIVLSTNPDYVEMVVDDFRIDNITYDAFSISGDLTIEHYELEPFPYARFNPADFPGIF